MKNGTILAVSFVVIALAVIVAYLLLNKPQVSPVTAITPTPVNYNVTYAQPKPEEVQTAAQKAQYFKDHDPGRPFSFEGGNGAEQWLQAGTGVLGLVTMFI